MARNKKDYWLIGDDAPDYFFSPKQSPPTPTPLDLNDWVVVKFYPGRVKEDVTFTKVEFTEVSTGQVKSTWTRSEGSWSVHPPRADHFLVADTAPEPSGQVRGITITNNEHLGQGKQDVHEFKLYFSDGGTASRLRGSRPTPRVTVK